MSFCDTSLQLEATDKMLAQAAELASRGLHVEAERLYQESLKNIVGLYGARTLKACSCLLELSDIYYHNEQYAEVITLLEQVLVTSQSEEIFADEKLLSIKFKLARALEKTGNLKQAGQCYSEVLSEATVVCGPTSTFTRTVVECVRLLAKRTAQTSSTETTSEPQDSSKHRFVREVPRNRAYNSEIDSPPQLLRRNLRAIITIPTACILVLWLFFSGVLEDKSGRTDKERETGASATAALNPTSLAEFAGHYSSTDGIKQFELQDGGKGLLVLGPDAEEVKVSKLSGELYAETEGLRVVFRPTGNSLVDEQGVKLFKRGTPELGVVAAARKLADDFNRYYARYGKYPRSQMSLQSAGISYSNALTLRPTHPKLMAVSSDNAGSSMTLADYQNANWMATNLLSMNGAMGEPGGIEVHVFPVSSVGETVYIRGFDRDGHLLPSSTVGKCFTVVLVAGTVSK
jgi:tetratricopeptide (TPR) repeat protein